MAVDAESLRISQNIHFELVGGHTKASQKVMTITKSGNRYVLVGDLYHVYEGYRGNATDLVKTNVRRWGFHSKAQALWDSRKKNQSYGWARSGVSWEVPYGTKNGSLTSLQYLWSI